MSRHLTARAAMLAMTAVATLGAQVGDDRPIARVGAVVFARSELLDLVRENSTSGDMRRLTEAMTPDGRERMVQGRVDLKLMALAARDSHLDQDPAVRRALDRTADAVLAQALIDTQQRSLDLSQPALRKYYDAHNAAFQTGARVKARHVVVKTREEAAAVQRELRAGADFGAIASARNVDNTRATSGELGWVTRGVMVAPFEAALFALRTGQHSEMVETAFGFHIIEAQEVDTGRLQPFETVIDALKQAMLGEAVNAVKTAAAANYPVVIHRDVVRQVRQ